MIVVLTGAPGAGKGTQAQQICSKLGIPQISTGDMLRTAIAKQTETGLKAKAFMDAGQLVPDDVVIAIVRERVADADCAGGYILDGFPRTIAQAEALDKILTEWNKRIDAVINIEVPERVLSLRLTGRRTCSQCGATYHIQFNPPLKATQCDICSGEIQQRSDDAAMDDAGLRVADQRFIPVEAHHAAATPHFIQPHAEEPAMRDIGEGAHDPGEVGKVTVSGQGWLSQTPVAGNSTWLVLISNIAPAKRIRLAG